MRGPALAAASSAALIALYLALGGASYRPLEVADPCDPRPPEQLRGGDGILERLALSSLDGAACSLRVTREDLALALADPERRAGFAREHGISEDEVADAAREGLLRAVDDAERAGGISSLEATLLREAAQRVPVGVLIDALRAAEEAGVIGVLEDLLRDSS